MDSCSDCRSLLPQWTAAGRRGRSGRCVTAAVDEVSRNEPAAAPTRRRSTEGCLVMDRPSRSCHVPRSAPVRLVLVYSCCRTTRLQTETMFTVKFTSQGWRRHIFGRATLLLVTVISLVRTPCLSATAHVQLSTKSWFWKTQYLIQNIVIKNKF